jgi:hypothetical protein
MEGMIRLSRACASLLVVFGVLTSMWATCTAGAMVSERAEIDAQMEMACCQAGHHECAPKGTPAECCKTETQREQWTATTTELVKAPALVALAVVPSIQGAYPIVLSRSSCFANISQPSPHLGPPAYIAHSALLI